MKRASGKCLRFVPLLALVASSLSAQSPFLQVVGPNFATVGSAANLTITGFDLAGTVGLPTVCYTPSGSGVSCPVVLAGVGVTSPNLLTATFPAQGSTSSGVINVRPDFGGTQIFSINALSFYVQTAGDPLVPAPVITSLSSSQVLAGSPDLGLTITGSGFSPPLDVSTVASLVVPGNSPVALSTAVQSGTQLLVTVPASLMTNVTSYLLFVSVGTRTTALVPFRVVGPAIFSDGFEAGNFSAWQTP